MNEAIDKQKVLLSAEVGHFSLVRAMHLADLITLMNGKSQLVHLRCLPAALAPAGRLAGRLAGWPVHEHWR